MELELGNVTLVGLAIIGVVNVATMFKPDLDNKTKFGLSVVVALVVGFIPEAISGEIFTRITTALTAAVAASGGYKIAQKIGGK